MIYFFNNFMKLYELKKWPKIWKIAEEAAKERKGSNYCEKISLSQAFSWIDTGYDFLFYELNFGNISEAKSLYPEMFDTEKIYELWT